jgi:membrane-bound lytic murein transglycosylase
VLQDVSTDVPIGPKVHVSLHEVLGCAEVHAMKDLLERNNRFLFFKLYTRQPGSKSLEKLAMRTNQSCAGVSSRMREGWQL